MSIRCMILIIPKQVKVICSFLFVDYKKKQLVKFQFVEYVEIAIIFKRGNQLFYR